MKYIVRAEAVCDFPSDSQMGVVLAERILEAGSAEEARGWAERYRQDLFRYANETLVEYAEIQIDVESLDDFLARLEAGSFEYLRCEGEEEDE